MEPQLTGPFKKLEESKARMLAGVACWTPGQMCQRPAPGAWSAAQVIDHITRVEAGILGTVRGNLPSVHRATPRERWGNFLVRLVLRSRMRVTVPKGAEKVLPGASCTGASAIAGWNKSRQQWRAFLEQAAPEDLVGGVFSHPRGGWMTLPETVTFLRLHHDHHRSQLQRIRRMLP